MKSTSVLLVVLLSLLAVADTLAQEVPFVYGVENTGADCTTPPLPGLAELPVVKPLTDPFEWSDGSGRDTTLENWRCRRAEIKAEIENYEIGQKPGRPDSLTASYSAGTLTVNVTTNGHTLTLTSAVSLPAGDGPFPAVIGIGRGSGSLPADLLSSRDIATIAFDFGQVMSHTQTRGSEPINRLYPELTYMGAYSAWSWGVSRLIDGLELVSEDLNVDLAHLAVTGCSFAGKMALYAAAFDERIALTIAQESGGGGAAAWRVSETLGEVETLGRTSHAWFIEDLFRFSNDVSKLPYDHHELMAMIAPRALLVLGNPDYKWLADESGYVSSRAAHEVWKTFGVPERFGFSIVGDHMHCLLPAVERPEVEAFVDAFLLGDTTANTNVTTHPYEHVDHSRWYGWWGSGDPVLPDWVGTWGTAPQLTEPGNMPPMPGLSSNTLRQVVHVSLGGSRLRMHFSNAFGSKPVTMQTVRLARSAGASAIDTTTERVLTFGGETAVTLPAGVEVISDPFDFTLEPLSDVAVTIFLGEVPEALTGHPGSRTTSFIAEGDAVDAPELTDAVPTDHWYIIKGIDVLTESALAVVTLGNSITDGRGSGTNLQNRWPDELARRLQSDADMPPVAVLNMGIGGNCVLRACLGPSALDRFDRDVLGRPGVRWLIILEGVNDIGGTANREQAMAVADSLISAYGRMIESAHERGILVYGATMLPFGGSFYDAPGREEARTRVNHWIRTSGAFDAVIDFDAALRDPSKPTVLRAEADTGDHLHPNEEGYRMMAAAINLALFRKASESQ